MLRRITILVLILALLPILIVAQQKALLQPGGKTVYLNSDQNPKEVFEVSNAKYHNKILSKNNPISTNGKIDTLENASLVSGFTSTFGGYGQDILVGWFAAPADLKILSVGYDCGDNPGLLQGELKLYKIGNGWTVSKLKSITTATNLGYWIAKGNGFLDIAAFEDEATEPKTWISHSAANPLTPFAEDIWSDAGTGAPTEPNNDGDRATYQWISMDLLGFQPEILGGEVFAIILKNTKTDIVAATANDRFGVMSSQDLRYGIFKYYSNGRTVGDTSTAGWWKREYIFNMVASVEITGDTPPAISGVSNPQGTLSTGPIEISATLTDDNPGGGAAGIKEAFVVYHTSENATDVELPMAVKSGDVWAGSIPGQVPGTKVTYQIKAVDQNNNVTISARTYSYVVFKPTAGVKTLMVLNGLAYDGDQENASEYPQNWIFGVNADGAAPEFYKFAKDVWAYGPLSEELVNNYDNILELAGSPNGPATYNDDVIKAWLAGGATRNYFLAGQEWLGSWNGYVDTSFVAGDFAYDILGVTRSYNDISYTGTGQNIASKLTAIDGSPIAGPMLTKFTALNTDSLCYDPYYEIGPSWANWIDGFDVLDGQAVDIQVESRGIAGTADVRTLSCATHRTLAAGNKIAFFSYDPLAVNSAPTYYWFGFDISSPQIQVLNWFGIETAVERIINNKPDKFALTQNYPNPFNPATTISFSVPEISNVSLKVYDMLGREVLTLVNGMKNSGTYEISFDASNLTSGLYVYTLTAGNFSASKKMMLLK